MSVRRSSQNDLYLNERTPPFNLLYRKAGFDFIHPLLYLGFKEFVS